MCSLQKKDLDTVKKEISVLKNLHHGYIVAYEESFEGVLTF